MGKRRVLIVHTGGTLGMHGTPLEPGTYAQTLHRQVPELERIAHLETRIVCNVDSSDLGPTEWTALAQVIAEERTRFDGLVVVHGTDTMAYTASALAFALTGLDRPVVLTGAQRPLAALRTDARRNLQDAVEVAALDVPEVGICFDGLLLRGCRAVKADARVYRAFDSPGTEPLARFGFDVDIGPHVRRPTEPFSVDARFDPRVAVVHVYPGLDPRFVERMIDGDVRGMVLAAFGVGTAPTVGPAALAPVVERAVARGITVFVVTQHGGIVDLSMYRNSRSLLEAGAIGGAKIRIEAAVPKLMHALALFPTDAEARRAWLERDVAGELS